MKRLTLGSALSLGITLLSLGALLYYGANQADGFSSSQAKSIEIGVATPSLVGNGIGLVIPASCPSYAHSPGQCGGSLSGAAPTASAAGSCSGSSPAISFGWNCGGGDTNAGVVINGNVVASGLPASGGYTATGLSPNTSYSWQIGCAPVTSPDQWPGGSVGTPSCGAGGNQGSSNQNPGGSTPPGGPPGSPPPGGNPPGGSPPGGNQGGPAACVPNGNCNAPAPACGQTTSGTNNCGGSCTRVGPACPPGVSILANNQASLTLFAPASYVITWTSTNADSCTATGAWNGSKPTAGSQSFSNVPAGVYNYGLLCTGPGGSAYNSVTVRAATIQEVQP